MTHLFQLGLFRIVSGVSQYKIDCDYLTDEDITSVATLLASIIPSYGSVEGVPTGGLRLATTMERFCRVGPLLIVDDVFTSGQSMEKHRGNRWAIGAVIFARKPTPDWITPLFQMTEVKETLP